MGEFTGEGLVELDLDIGGLLVDLVEINDFDGSFTVGFDVIAQEDVTECTTTEIVFFVVFIGGEEVLTDLHLLDLNRLLDLHLLTVCTHLRTISLTSILIVVHNK